MVRRAFVGKKIVTGVGKGKTEEKRLFLAFHGTWCQGVFVRVKSM